MNLKGFIVGLAKKLYKQGATKGIVNVLKNKALHYIRAGEKNFIVDLIMDRFVPRDVRKFIQKLELIDDMIEGVLFRFADFMNDDGIKEEVVIKVFAILERYIIRFHEMVLAAKNRLDLTSEELSKLNEKIEQKMIDVDSDNVVMSDLPYVDTDGFESID